MGSIETPESFAKHQKAYKKPSSAPNKQESECSSPKSDYSDQEEAIRYWKEVAESMRIKNRLLRLFGKYRSNTKG
jgi:hypothetical protein